jgi:hypothetical protein
VVGHVRRLLIELYTKGHRDPIDPTREPAIPIEGVVGYFVSALIGLVQWGLERDEPATPEQLYAVTEA